MSARALQFAVLADIHGNLQALDAVLADPRCAAADEVIVLGDVVAGTFPAECFDRLCGLGDRVRLLRGNADRIVLEDDGDESRWARDRLGRDRLATVAAWPTSFVLEVRQLGRVRCCHATPHSDEEILTPITPEPVAARFFEGTLETVVLGGHTHIQFERHVASWRFVNVGSVGRPREVRPAAYWALVGPDVQLVSTDYDVVAATEAVLASGQPSASQVVEVLLRPPTPEEAARVLEGWRIEAAGGG
jgi:predicted phosphodiesterase